MLYQQDRTWLGFALQYLTLTGEQQIADAYYTLNTLLYSITPMLGIIPGNIDRHGMTDFLLNQRHSADINTIKFLFCDIVLYLLTILTYIYYKARLIITRDPRIKRDLESEQQQTTLILSRIKGVILMCWISFRYYTEVTVTMGTRLGPLDLGRIIGDGTSTPAFTGVKNYKELLTDIHALALGGYFSFSTLRGRLTLGNGGTAPPALGDGSDGGGSSRYEDRLERQRQRQRRNAVREHWMKNNEKKYP